MNYKSKNITRYFFSKSKYLLKAWTKESTHNHEKLKGQLNQRPYAQCSLGVVRVNSEIKGVHEHAGTISDDTQE